MFFPFPINPLFPFPVIPPSPLIFNPLNTINPNIAVKSKYSGKVSGGNLLGQLSTMKSNNGIEIDIPDVTPETKVSDLTVPQLVNLLVQVSEQLYAPRTGCSPDLTGKFIEQINKLTAQGGGKDPKAINDMVRQFQQAIGDSMPKLKPQASPNSMQPSENK